MVGYLSMINLGAILLGLSTAKPEGVESAMAMLATRGFSLVVWGITLQALRSKKQGDRLEDLRGLASTKPLSCAGAVLSGLALIGLPGLLSFPGFWAVLRSLSPSGVTSGTIWPLLILILSMAAGVVACLRFARVMLEASIGWPLPEEGGRSYRLLVGSSIVCFFLFGLLPQLFLPWVASFARAFTNLVGAP
jgi:NADH-quinone oxidoreductase subunit M